MRANKALILNAGSLLLCVFLYPLFNTDKLSAETMDSMGKEATEMKAICVLGEKVKEFPFYVYSDADSGENNFFPTGNMGDLNGRDVDAYCDESPYSGSRCVKIVYKIKQGKSFGWVGSYWQYPPNNWGNIPKAYDLTGATKLTFWARGKVGREVINKFQVGGITGKYRDSGIASIGPVTLSKEWKKYTINLKNMNDSIIISNEDRECWPFMEPLSRIIGGFCWATSSKVNDNQGITFYLDEIRFEND